MTYPKSLQAAEWIGSSIVGGKRSSPPSPYFRKTFRLAGAVQSARLAITALGLYECEINGKRVGDHVLAPGWTDYRKRVNYQTFDVSDHLLIGDNVIGTILGDGWYCGHLGWKHRQNYGDRPALLAQLEVVFADGSTQLIATDSSWQTSTGPILESDLLGGESYDALQELGPWSEAKFDDANWRSPIVFPPFAIELSRSAGPPIRRIEEIKAISTRDFSQWPEDIRVIDFGQNFTGWIRLTVEAPKGTLFTLRYAEVLGSDGRVYTENLRTARVTDYYTCKGDGVEIWEPRFTFHGFRYVQIAGVNQAKSVEATGVVIHSDTEPTGHFACSNPLLNQLQSNIVWGQKGNFLDVPMDCPQRDERLGWTGDAQVFIRTAAFNMNVKGFFRKWMQDVRDAQLPEGGIPPVVPHMDMGLEDGGPAWADATIICPWTIYLCYGDLEILRDHYHSMQRFMEFLAKHRCLGYIRSHPEMDKWGGFGDWLALDGSDQRDGATARDLIGTAFYAYDALLMSKIAGILGHENDAGYYTELNREIVVSFQKRFTTGEGLLVSNTQTAYVLALHFELLPESLRKAATEELVRNIEKRGWHLSTGFVGTPYLLEVLETQGRLDLAYKLLEQESFPSWLFPIKNGATTIWERWNGWTPEKGFQDHTMNSFNHYAYGAVGAWVYRSVAGLELDHEAPAYQHIIFRPRPGGSITWAEGCLTSEHGAIAIHWKLEEGKLVIELTVPVQCRASLSLPSGFFVSSSEYLDGKFSITAEESGDGSVDTGLYFLEPSNKRIAAISPTDGVAEISMTVEF